MKKLSKTRAYFAPIAAAAILSAGAGPAQGAGNGQLMESRILEKFSAADVSSMLGEFKIQLALQPYDGDGPSTMLATTEGGAQFIISMFQCDDVASGQGCKQALVYTGLPNAGFSYDDLNAFNGRADVTRAVNVPDQQIILFGTQIYSHGGIGRENFQLLTALFLNDMQTFIDSLSGGASSVAMKIKQSRGKTGNVVAGETSAGETSTLENRMVDHALSAAVSNTRRVEFLTGEAAKFVE